MKKLAVVILAILYLGTASGATVNIHYCMGKFVEWGFGHSTTDKCSSCGMLKNISKKNCCQDENKLIKLDGDHKSSEIFFSFLQLSAPPFFSSYELPVAGDIYALVEKYPVVNAPPRANAEDTFILDRSIRI
jgi:hypothetical protein